MLWDVEAGGQPSLNADGDDLATSDDEDGVSSVGSWYPAGNGQVSVNVNSSTGSCTGCKLGFWFDWNVNGNFADAGETYLMNVVNGDQTLTFAIPAGASTTNVYARFRLYAADYTGSYLPVGLVTNGEVEDYYFAVPTAVTLKSFTAASHGVYVQVGWETARELGNLGFNLYRSTRSLGPGTRINAELITSQVAPGSPFGAAYTYVDATAKPWVSNYYWIEAVGTSGATTLIGPIGVAAR